MNTAYTNGAEQNTETGKRQMANFAEAAKGMGFALGIYAAAEKSVKEFGSAQQNRTVTEVDSAWSGREGDLGAVSFGMASVILAYAGRKEIKKAFVYGVKGLYKASKRTLSFAKKAVDELQALTQEYVAEDRANPERNTLFNKINKFMGHSR